MISVCMATYNGEKYLREQVDSILAQLNEKDELVVSDDGSTDNTIEILKSYNDSRIKIFHNKSRHGVNGNFENTLLNAIGEYIFLSDQDDVWLPNKVEICMQAMKKKDCVLHDCYVTNQKLDIISQSIFKDNNVRVGVLHNIVKNGFTGCCMAFKRNVLSEILPFPVKSKFYHDQWIGLKSTLKFSVAYIDIPLILFRRHSSNSSTASGKSLMNLTSKIYYRFQLCKALIFN